MSSREEEQAMVKIHAQRLLEHFDSVQIFVTRHNPSMKDEEDGTISVVWGDGNWFARMGLVRDWITKQDEQTRSDVRKEE